MEEEVKEPGMSPVVVKMPVKNDGTMTFSVCLEKLLLGERCRRLEWNDEGIFIALHNEQLVIYKPEDKKLHPLTVSAGDISGTDWVVVGKQESLS